MPSKYAAQCSHIAIQLHTKAAQCLSQVWRNITGLLCHGGLSKIESCSWHVACLSYAIRRAVDNISLTNFPAIHDYTVAQACKGIVQLLKGIQGGKPVAHLPAS
jgi:hypothetical protein